MDKSEFESQGGHNMRGLFRSRLVKKGDQLVYPDGNSILYKEFLAELPEGTQVSLTIEVLGKEKSLTQLALVHTYIKILAEHTGNSFAVIKRQIKQEAGLFDIKDDKYVLKSFGDCSTDELSMAIQSCIELGDFLGVNLR
jgi:hypothetical protein